MHFLRIPLSLILSWMMILPPTFSKEYLAPVSITHQPLSKAFLLNFASLVAHRDLATGKEKFNQTIHLETKAKKMRLQGYDSFSVLLPSTEDRFSPHSKMKAVCVLYKKKGVQLLSIVRVNPKNFSAEFLFQELPYSGELSKKTLFTTLSQKLTEDEYSQDKNMKALVKSLRVFALLPKEKSQRPLSFFTPSLQKTVAIFLIVLSTVFNLSPFFKNTISEARTNNPIIVAQNPWDRISPLEYPVDTMNRNSPEHKELMRKIHGKYLLMLFDESRVQRVNRALQLIQAAFTPLGDQARIPALLDFKNLPSYPKSPVDLEFFLSIRPSIKHIVERLAPFAEEVSGQEGADSFRDAILELDNSVEDIKSKEKNLEDFKNLVELAQKNPENLKIQDEDFKTLYTHAQQDPYATASYGALITRSHPKEAEELVRRLKDIPEVLILWGLELSGQEKTSITSQTIPDFIRYGLRDTQLKRMQQMSQTSAGRLILGSTILLFYPQLVNPNHSFHHMIRAWEKIYNTPFDFQEYVNILASPSHSDKQIEELFLEEQKKISASFGKLLQELWNQERWEEFNKTVNLLKEFPMMWESFLPEDVLPFLKTLDTIIWNPFSEQKAAQSLVNNVFGTGWAPVFQIIREAPERLRSGSASWDETVDAIAEALKDIPKEKREKTSPIKGFYQKEMFSLIVRVYLDQNLNVGFSPAAKAQFIQELDKMANFSNPLNRADYNRYPLEFISFPPYAFLIPEELNDYILLLRHEIEHALSKKNRTVFGDDMYNILTLRPPVMEAIGFQMEKEELTGSPWEMYPKISLTEKNLRSVLKLRKNSIIQKKDIIDLNAISKDARNFLDFYVLLRNRIRIVPPYIMKGLEAALSTDVKGEKINQWLNAVAEKEGHLHRHSDKAERFGRTLAADWLTRAPLVNPNQVFAHEDLDFKQLRFEIAHAQGVAADKVRKTLNVKANQEGLEELEAIPDEILFSQINNIMTGELLPDARSLEPWSNFEFYSDYGEKNLSESELRIEANKARLKELYPLSTVHPMEGLDPARAVIAELLMMRLYDAFHDQVINLAHRKSSKSNKQIEQSVSSFLRAHLSDLIVTSLKKESISEKIDHPEAFVYADQLTKKISAKVEVDTVLKLVLQDVIKPDLWSFRFENPTDEKIHNHILTVMEDLDPSNPKQQKGAMEEIVNIFELNNRGPRKKNRAAAMEIVASLGYDLKNPSHLREINLTEKHSVSFAA
jgi:hypothetical protein